MGWVDHRGTVTWEGRTAGPFMPPWTAAPPGFAGSLPNGNGGYPQPGAAGTTPWGGAGPARPSLASRCARAAGYTFSAIRFQFRLFALLVIFGVVLGMCALTFVPPVYRVDVRVPAFDDGALLATDGSAATPGRSATSMAATAQFTPADIAAILASPAILDRLADRLSASPPSTLEPIGPAERLLDVATTDGLAPAAVAATLALSEGRKAWLGWEPQQFPGAPIARWKAAFGIGGSSLDGGDAGQPTLASAGPLEADAFRVQATPASERMVLLTVEAPSPQLASQGAETLLAMVAEHLGAAVTASAARRLEEMRPDLDAARVAAEEARLAVERFRALPGQQDPVGDAELAQQDLARTRSEIASTEIALQEHQAARGTMTAHIQALEERQVGQVVEQNNPRIAELKREISDLEVQYNSMTTKTDRHPDKAGVLKALEAKREELAEEEQTVIERTVRERSPEYTAATSQLRNIDTELVRLAERSARLAASEAAIVTRLESLVLAAAELDRLMSTDEEAQQRWATLHREASRLQNSIDDRTRFAYLRPLDLPALSEAVQRPVRPHGPTWLAASFGLAVVLSTLTCVSRAASGRRTLCRWQVDDLLARVGDVQVLAEIPSRRAVAESALAWSAHSPD